MEQVSAALFSNFWEEKAGQATAALRGLPDDSAPERLMPAYLPRSLAILFRASGITTYAENKGTLETARKMLLTNHHTPRGYTTEPTTG
jgi:hypothetical protein